MAIPTEDIVSVRTCLQGWAPHSDQRERDNTVRGIVQETRRRYVVLADSIQELREAMTSILPDGPLQWGLY